MFFQCIGVLLSPTNPIQRGMKWALVVHTVAMFIFITIPIGIYLNGLSVAYINDRRFPGGGEYPPGPIGYTYIISTEATTTVLNVMIPLNQWLADSLLVGPSSNSVASLFNVGRPSSCTVATSFIPGIVGSWPSHAWCISPLSVRDQVPQVYDDMLTNTCSDGCCGCLPGIGNTGLRCRLVQLQYFLLFNFPFAQHPPHSHDCHATHSVYQEHSKSHWGPIWIYWTKHGCCRSSHDTYRVLCALRCRSSAIYGTLGHR